MNEEYVFYPERRQGVIFHLAALALLSVVGLAGLYEASRANIGPAFLVYLLPALAALGAAPLLAYRYYSLQNSSYTLEREGVRLRWGLRVEEIPIDDILWVRPASELKRPLPLPRLHWPGAVIGRRRMSGAGEIEFLAGQARDLVLIATQAGGYAVSPADVDGFLEAFQRVTEMGSLVRMSGRSVYPTVLLSRVWQSPVARVLLLAGGGLSLALLVTVSLAVPGREQVVFGFKPNGQPGDPAPAVRLLLLPVINTLFFLIDLFLGLYYFRRAESQSLAYVLWAAGALVAGLFLMAAVFMLLAS